MVSRPLSPHLQIYRLPLAARISITHRIIGVAFFAASFVVSLYCLMTVVGFDLIWLDVLLFSAFAKIKLSFLAGALCFYIVSELRYIFWGFNLGISPAFINVSNILIVSAGLLAGVFSFFVMWR